MHLGVQLTPELCHLRLRFVARFFQDGWDFGVGDKVLPALLIPVEEHPDPVGLIRIAKDGRTLGTMLLSLLSALAFKYLHPAVEIFDLRCGEYHDAIPFRVWLIGYFIPCMLSFGSIITR